MNFIVQWVTVNVECRIMFHLQLLAQIHVLIFLLLYMYNTRERANISVPGRSLLGCDFTRCIVGMRARTANFFGTAPE